MGIYIVPDRDGSGDVATHQAPFKSKAVVGGKLFRRKHGFLKLIPANSSDVILLVVPYAVCKINHVEFMNTNLGDTIDFEVLDTSTGTFSTVPNYMLNQFGFDVQLPDGRYEDTSEYDADLIADMTIRITYNNSTNADHTLRGNIVYHEVVSWKK